MQSPVLKKNQPVHSNTDRIAKPVDKKYVKPAEKQESAPEVKKWFVSHILYDIDVLI